MYVFFFFKQKTAYEMRISDWSSDVCSSDLQRHQGLAHLEFGDGGLDIQVRIDAECFRRRLDRLLVAGGEGAQRVLDAVAKLARHILRNVDGVLRHEIDAHALGSDQSHHLLDLDRKSTRLTSSH